MQVSAGCKASVCNDSSVTFGFAESMNVDPLYACQTKQFQPCASMLSLMCPVFLLFLLAVSQKPEVLSSMHSINLPL